MRAKPLTGAILGVVLGLAVAVVLQQQGIWPLDRLTVFFLPAILGFLVLLLLSMGKEASVATFVIALIILVPMGVWGALGLGGLNEVGQLNGGCLVQAQSSAPDSTNVTDTSKQDPFLIDPQGSLNWQAASPTIFDDYPWEIWVEIGGAQITLDKEESQDNDGGSPVNEGNVGNVEAYAAERGIDISELRGVYKVGGFASTCNGFGFVTLIADPFETLASQIALAVIIIIIIFIIVIMIVSRGGKAAASATVAAAGAAGTGGEGSIPGDVDGDGDVDFDDAAGTIENYEPGQEDLPNRDDLA